MSSFQALTGRCISLPISIATASNISGTEVLPIIEMFDKIIRKLFLSKGKSLKFRSHGYSNRLRSFSKGNLVWLYIAVSRQIDTSWHGPFVVVRKIGSVCYIIQPILTSGKELFVHISRIKKCTADLGSIKNHLGIYEPTDDQLLDLYTEIETADGYDLDDVINDHQNDDHNNELSAESVNEPVLESKSTKNDYETDPPLTNLSQKDINVGQSLVEKQLNLVPSSVPTSVAEKSATRKPIILIKKGTTKKPIKERWFLAQSISQKSVNSI